jgi:phospholipid/cholesterol/gamma-HCH transport system substrate-binding protein
MHRNVIETVMGGVVLLVAVFFLIFAYSAADLRQVDGYELVARFDQVDGLAPGADVRISGVRVGSVIGQELNTQSYLAEVRMSIDPSVEIPEDTIAEVTSEGLLGGKFMSLSPGGSDVMLEPGSTIQFTQSTPGLEQLLGQVIFSLQDLGNSDGGSGDGSGGSGGDSLGAPLP